MILLGALAASRDWDCEPTATGLVVERYPFGEATRTVAWSDVTEVCVGWAPPAVRLRAGEYLFVPALRVRALADQARHNTVPFVDRFDVWSLILDPFLDTEHGGDWEERLLVNLESQGVTRAETQSLRAEPGSAEKLLALFPARPEGTP